VSTDDQDEEREVSERREALRLTLATMKNDDEKAKLIAAFEAAEQHRREAGERDEKNERDWLAVLTARVRESRAAMSVQQRDEHEEIEHQLAGRHLYSVVDRTALQVRASRPLSDAEDTALVRAFFLIEQLSLCQEVLLRDDTDDTSRQHALSFIDRAFQGTAAVKEKTAAWLRIAEAVEAVPANMRGGHPAAFAILRGAFGHRAAALADLDLIELVRCWHELGASKWKTFRAICAKAGLAMPDKEQAIKREWQLWKEKKAEGG